MGLSLLCQKIYKNYIAHEVIRINQEATEDLRQALSAILKHSGA